ncbi:MAG: response regulator [Ruminococcus sp.]|nr:response regulator [Ruminococcus sp.]MBQ6387370.1 response regulator [Ruminococcus sp.]
MLIFAIDDEENMLYLLHQAIAKAQPDAQIMDFGDDDELIGAITEQKKIPDVVFSDIELRGGVNGLELAVRIKNLSPDTKIIFVTGYPQYAADAFRMHANGYILKPADPKRIREELDYLNLSHPRPELHEKLYARCFGSFQVFWHGEPLLFKRSRTRELFAFLIDREGAVCSGEEIIAAMWEDDSKLKAAKQYLRALTQDLRNTLSSIGMEAVFIRKHNQWAIRKDLLDCDYYRLLDGETDAVNAYRGDYMEQYTWSELTAARLHFRAV